MNWAPEVAVQAEIDYRVERALGHRDGQTHREHVRAVREKHRSWWQRRSHDESTGGPKAAA